MQNHGWPRLRKRIGWIFGFTLLAALCAGMLAAWVLPNEYEARASLVPLQGREILGINPQIFGIELLEDILSANLPTSFDELSGVKIRAVLESFWLSRMIVEEHDLAHGLLDLPAETRLQPIEMEEAVLLLQSRMRLGITRLSDILNISFLASDPTEGAVMIQRYLDTLDQFLRKQTIERAQSNATYLEKVRDTLRDRELIERLNSLIMTQYEQVAYAQASGNVFFEVLEPPHPRFQPVGPNPFLYAFAAGFIAACCTALGALLLPVSDRS